MAWVKACAKRVVLLLGLAWMKRSCPGGEGVPFDDEVLDVPGVDKVPFLNSRRICLVNCFSS